MTPGHRVADVLAGFAAAQIALTFVLYGIEAYDAEEAVVHTLFGIAALLGVIALYVHGRWRP